jgi:hypothetical protein
VTIPVAARGLVFVCSHSFAGDCGLESVLGLGIHYLVSVVFCQIEVPATGRTLVQRGLNGCHVSERVLETTV